MNTDLNVCTYNIGSGLEEFRKLSDYFDTTPKKKDKQTEDAFSKTYENIESSAAETLAELVDVICFQNIIQLERPMIKILKQKDFRFFFADKASSIDTAVAISNVRFQNFKNITNTYENKDGMSAVITAVDRITNLPMAFASFHMPLSINHADYWASLVDQVTELKDCSVQIIGADMIYSPEIGPKKFYIAEEKGFTLHRTFYATAINPCRQYDQQHESDFIFTKEISNPIRKLRSIFSTSLEFNPRINQEISNGWEKNKHINASMHKPVFVDMSFRQKKPLFNFG